MNNTPIPNQKEAAKLWSKYILALGKFTSLEDRISQVRSALELYFEEMETSFVSNNTSSFRKHLESKLGPIHFAKNIAMNIKDGKTTIFIEGKVTEF